MNIEETFDRKSIIAFEPIAPPGTQLDTFTTCPSTLKKAKYSMLRRVCHSKFTQALLPKDLKKDSRQVASESIASAVECPSALTKSVEPKSQHEWTSERLVEKYGRSASDVLKLVRDTHTSVLTPHKENGNAGRARNCVKKVAQNVNASFRSTKGAKKTKNPSSPMVNLVNDLKSIKNSPGLLTTLTMLMTGSANKLSDDDLEETMSAIKDVGTYNALLRDVAPEHAMDLKTVLTTIRKQAHEELEHRYKTLPLLILIAARDNLSNKFNQPDPNTARTANPEDATFQLLKDASLDIHKAMRLLLRGWECGHLQTLGQERQKFFAEVVRTVPQENLESLRIVMGLGEFGERWRACAVMSETSEVMSAYILGTYDEVGIAIQAMDPSATIRRNDNSSPADWLDPSEGDAHPNLKAGWIRRAGNDIAQRARYAVGTGSTRAEIRMQYLENNIDKRTRALILKLIRTPQYDNNEAQATICRLQDRFHEAIDALDAELTKRGGPGLKSGHATEAVQRVLSEFDGNLLMDIPKKLQSWPAPSTPLAGPPPGILNWVRNKLHWLGLHWRNRFHDHTQIKFRRSNWKSGHDRRVETFDAIRHSLPQVRLIRSTLFHLKKLSPLLTGGAGKNYDGITEIIRKLSVLGAEDRGGSPDFHKQICKTALNKLTKDELNNVMSRLHKYSGQYGKKMQAFYKAEQSRNDSTSDEDYMLKKSLEVLYSAGRQLDWAPRPDTNQDSPTETDSSGRTTPTRSSDSSPVRAAKEALELTHAAAQIVPMKHLLAVRNAISV